MQLTTFESRHRQRGKIGLALFVYYQNIVTNKKYLKRELEKIKFVVKLILFYMNVRCYIKFKKKKKENQREPNPSLRHGSQALKQLHYTALLEKSPNKRLYK